MRNRTCPRRVLALVRPRVQALRCPAPPPQRARRVPGPLFEVATTSVFRILLPYNQPGKFPGARLMQHRQRIGGTVIAALLVIVTLSSVSVHSQGGAPTRFVTPPDQVIAVRAGRLFDSRSGTVLTNQVILIKGDRITLVGPSLAIPPGAQVIDLSAATVMPGMIDAHVHLFPADNLSESTRTIVGVANAQTDLNAGFTTVLDMDSRGG